MHFLFSRVARCALPWAFVLVSARGALAQADEDDDMLPGRSPEQVEALFANLDEVIETIMLYAASGATLVILLGLSLFLRLPRWAAYVSLTLISLIWLAYFEQHLTGQFWLGTRPGFDALLLLGVALASLHMIVTALAILPRAPLGWMGFVLVPGAALIWGLLWVAGMPEAVQVPPLLLALPVIALLSHAAAIPSFLRLQGDLSGVGRNGYVFALTLTTAALAALLFGELSEEIDVVFLLRLGLLALVAYFAIFFVRFVLALLWQRDANARLAVEAAQREAQKTQALLEAEQNYSRAREAARLHTLRLAEASHDIRQPIASLRSTMAAVAKDQSPETRAQLTAAFDYLDGLARSYLDTGEAENAPLRQSEDGVEQVEAQMIVATLDRMFRKEAEGRNLTFETAADDATLHLQPLTLIRVLSNLLSNAIKHTETGQIGLKGITTTDGFQFSVTNTAPLPDGTDGAALFDPFVKGDASGGKGLGLSIVDSLSKRLGWHLAWSSDDSTGTVFSVTLPHPSR